MIDERRNPYVILGVAFGATQAEALRGFAKASRRLERNHGASFSLEDLTWALHQIEQIIIDPELALDVYRVPANRTVSTLRARGVFNPTAQSLPRRSNRLDEAIVAKAKLLAARQILLDSLSDIDFHVDMEMPYEMKEVQL